MKKNLVCLSLLVFAAFSVSAQGLINFTTGAAAASKISTNTVANGGTVSLTAGSGGQYIYALYVSTTASSVNGLTTSLSGNTNNNYVFNDAAWTLVGYGTNTATIGRLSGVNNSGGYTVVPGVAGGSNARFVVMGWSASIGNSIASVQNWFNSGNPVSDGWLGQSAVSSSLTLGDGGLVVTPGLFGSTSLSGFLLGRVAGGLYASPSITLHPTNQTVDVGGTTSFTVTAGGEVDLSLAAQWRLNGVNINAGGNYSITSTNYSDYYFFIRRGIFTLTVTNAQLTNAGNFSVLISNASGSATSSNALLSITGVPPLILNQPTNVAALTGNSVAFAVTVSGSPPLNYQWKFNGTNIANGTNISLPLLNVQLADAGNYSVSISNAFGSTNSADGVLTVQPGIPPVITAQPVSAIVQTGNNATFSVGMSGSGSLSYQWLFNGTNLSEATNASLVLSAVQTNKAGSYAVNISSPFGATNSQSATLTVVLPGGYVLFANSSLAATRIFTNSEVAGGPTGYAFTNGGGYIYALFASAIAVNVSGQTTPVLGADNNNYAFNDPNWNLVAYATSKNQPGRLVAVSPNPSGQSVVSGIPGGSSARFVVVGWSANIGNNVAAVQSWFNNGSVSYDGWVGQSSVSGSLALGDGGIIPSQAVFGSSSPKLQGFTLGLVQPVAAVTRYVASALPAPAISTELAGHSLKLLWSASAGSYGVQSASNPNGPWTDTGLSIVAEGANSTVTIPTTNLQQFFRLIVQ